MKLLTRPFHQLHVVLFPVDRQLVPMVVAHDHHHLRRHILMVFYGHVHLRPITAPVVPVFPGFLVFVGHYVEGIADHKGYVLVLRSVVDAVLSNELQWPVSIVLLEDPDDALWEGNAKSIGLRVQEFYFVSRGEVGLWVASDGNPDFIVLPYR